MNFENKIALVTGGSSGIGLATALGWARHGGDVVIADVNMAGAAKAVAEIEAMGRQALAIETDVTVQATIDNAVAVTKTRFGRIDFLHNNAFAPWLGETGGALLAEVSDDHWYHVMRLALDSTFRFSRAVIPLMIEQGGGAIVNTSSVAGIHAEPHVSAYGVAKAGISHMTRAIAVEYAGKGIRCNAVCPGVIQTVRAKPSPLPANFIESIPMRRLGQTDEIANVILFLASDLASYVTGALVVADGGRTI